MALTYAQRDALALVLVTGNFPKHCHTDTRVALIRATKLTEGCLGYEVEPEWVPEAQKSRMYKACAWLQGQGFQLDVMRGERFKVSNVRFIKPTEEGTIRAFVSGGRVYMSEPGQFPAREVKAFKNG
jgi:hypothetical protein